MSNPYLSMTGLASLDTLLDANEIAIVVGPSGGQGTESSIGSIPLSSFRDNYLLVEVNEQITALQSKPGNGAFTNPITMTFAGVVTGSVAFDGTENVTATLAMPNNSIPISAVTDLASTIAALESETTAPPQLESSYYSNLNGTSQTSILGYWNPSSSNTNGEDQYGTVLQLASDGSLGPSSSNYLNQLLFGSNGTLNWRRNVNNAGWTLVNIWHSGNFTPSSYLPATGGTINNSAASTALTVESSGSTQTLLVEDTGANGVSILMTGNGATTPNKYLRVVGGVFEVLNNAGTGALMSLTDAGAMSVTGAVTTPDVIFGVSASNNWGQIMLASTGTAYLWGPGGSGDNILQITRAGTASYTTTHFGTFVASQSGSGNALEVISSGSQLGLWVQDSGGNGANIKLTGNGSTTPSKTLRVINGSFQIINNAYTGSIFTMDDSGDITTGGTISSGAITTTGLTVNGGATFTGQINANGSSAIEATWPVATGGIANSGNGGNNGVVNHANNNGTSGATSCAALTFIRDGNFGCYLGIDTDNGFKVGGWSFGNNAYQIAHAGLSSFTFAGTVSSVGVANFNTSDRRLKKNLRLRAVRPLHRKLKWYGYDRIDIEASGLGPLAQDVAKTEKLYVQEYDHPLKDTGGKTIKRLTIDKSGIALEEAMWAGQTVDTLLKQVKVLEKRLTKAEAELRRFKKRA